MKADEHLTGVSDGDNAVVGDWLITFDWHDNRRACGGVAMTTLLTISGVRRLDPGLSMSPVFPGTGMSLTSFALTSLNHVTDKDYIGPKPPYGRKHCIDCM